MKAGIIVFPTDRSVDVRDLARMVEERGFESLFFPEHTHIPVDRRSPFPIGGELPYAYAHNLDPFVAHAAAASVTEKLRLGTGICLVAQREPIVLAKVVATLDQLSGGRVVLGVGAGWNAEEMRNHGVDPVSRWAVAREHVLALKSIWTTDKASFAGEHVRFDALWSWPKPVQQPHPPVLVGGSTTRSLARVLDFGDGWIPALDGPVEPLLARLAELEQMCAERSQSLPPVTVAFGFGRDAERAELERLRDAGVERALLAIPPGSYDETASSLDRLIPLVDSVALRTT